MLRLPIQLTRYKEEFEKLVDLVTNFKGIEEALRTRTPHFCTHTPAHPSIKSDMINASLGIDASYMTSGL
jgi:hypothetical protein